MRFDQTLLDEIRARLPVSQVVARKVQLKRKGREFCGLSPFKDEKTPSFTVNDQKGFYHCFASGAHGDIFKFVMEMEGLSFPEAVERLAEEAGVPMPVREEPTPEMQRRSSEQERLYELLDFAARYFQDQYRASAGRGAREYLDRRGLTRGTIDKFQIGFAPNSRNGLRQELSKAGFTDHEMGLSGMSIHGEDIAVPYDRFRGRIMFPIHDLKGRVIAFGGRALHPDVPAKYLNSPETPLFHKGAILYNAAAARQPAYECEQIIVVEGYMDVVALTQAGFANAVAPLGTALTEGQIKLLWRLSPEPLLCFDGDIAGKKAAYRAVDTVLPHLLPGQSLTFAFMPDGLDPDDLIRAEGPEALSAVLNHARPLSDVLWEREWADGQWHTPERRAALEKRVLQLLEGIQDQSVRNHYQRAMRDKLFQAWVHTGRGTRAPSGNRSSGWTKPGGQQGYGSGGYTKGTNRNRGDRWTNGSGGAGGGPRSGYGYDRFAAPPTASSALKQSKIVAGGASDLPTREVLLIQVLLNHPWLIDDQCEEIAELEFTSNSLRELRDGILSVHAVNNPLDRTALRTQLTKLGLDRLLIRAERAITHRSDRFAEPDADAALARTGWRHAVALHGKQLSLKRALDAAQRAWDEDGSEQAQARIFELKRRLFFEDQDTDLSAEAVSQPLPGYQANPGDVTPDPTST